MLPRSDDVTWCEREAAELLLVGRFAQLLDPGNTHLVIVVAADVVHHPSLQGVGRLSNVQHVAVEDALLQVRRDHAQSYFARGDGGGIESASVDPLQRHDAVDALFIGQRYRTDAAAACLPSKLCVSTEDSEWVVPGVLGGGV